MAAADVAKEEVKAAVADPGQPPPDIPANLVKCIEKPTPPGKTADEKVRKELMTADQRRECMRAMLAWYKEYQKAEAKKLAGKKTAAIVPIKP